ncbi:MAG TPA: sugar ABC transporter permease [Candidatus Limnocylindria bacterium]|nr:sugar ABC transporter permease [Candidatus Limnocylindria bacterium]
MSDKPRRRTALGALKHVLYSPGAAPYLFVLPFVAAFLLFFLYPTLQTIYMSFHRVLSLTNMQYIGLRNYQRLNNAQFLGALRLNTHFTLITVALLIPLPVTFAAMLNSRLIKGRNFFRSALFIPSLTSVIVAGISFRLIFGSLEFSVANRVMAAFGQMPVRWNLVYWPSIVIMASLSIWRMTGVYMIYFLSGLQSVPAELYESADIDGANFLQKFFRITVPLLKPTIVYVLTLVVFEGYRMFTESYVYWNENTPGGLGLTITRYIYQEAFRKNDMGFGSAIGITLLGIVMVINVIQLTGFGLFRKER